MSRELRASREALEELWREGLSGHALLDRHTQLVDDFLRLALADLGEIGAHSALVALGGYGRRELFPYSDIDLMLLYDPKIESELDAVVTKVFYPLWDSGLEVGHAVRSIEACLTDAEKDFFFQVALLDGRLVGGSAELFDRLQRIYREHHVEGRRKTFLQDMLWHRGERHRRFGKHGYLLEPHIKESRGGLRDIQAMLWIGQVVFGLRNLDDMENAGLLTPAEKEEFKAAWDQLIRIRNRLHYISGRKNDQLFFEHQEEMAKAFGYRTRDGILGVELFMRDVYGYLQTISVQTDLFFEHVLEVLDLAETAMADRELETGIELRGGHIHLRDHDLLGQRPHLLMRLFVQMAKTAAPMHHRTRKLVSDHLHLVDDRLRRSKRMGKAFIEILTEARDPEAVLTALLETGLLTAYIPEFAAVVSLAQHDVYHVYTVDRHLVQAVVELHLMREQEADKFASLVAPHLLFLATLLHDVGKGSSSDHSETGARLVEEIGLRLGLTDEEVATLVYVVREHLFLVDTAMRRDLEDEALILRCTRHIRHAERLTMLYLVSMADARATGPTVWTEWKAALLLELYLKILHLLERSDLADPDRIQNVRWMRARLLELLQPHEVKLVDVLPEDYLLSITPEKAAHHIALKDGLRGGTVVLEKEQRNGHWSLLIMARDRTGLLARICGTLALHNLNVLSAQIFTWADGTAVDLLNVQPWAATAFDDQDWQGLERDMQLALGNQLGLEHRLVKKSFPRLGTRKMGVRPKSRVVIDNQTSDFYTIIEVYVDDRPKLLYDVTRILADFDLGIARAKIGTKVDQMVNVFYVRDALGEKIEDAELQREISNALLFIADNGA